jgi:hypothetical protein
MSAAAQADAQLLPELASVYWRPRMTAERLRRRERLWTLTTLAHIVPFVVVAIVMVLLSPLALPVSLAALAHAWLIPELYARRGATVTRELPRAPEGPERVSLGLLGDLVDHDARDLHACTGLVPEPAQLGTWLVGEAGALLVAGRRVSCWCVRATDPEGARLPSGDRVAHLLLALRSDEEGFATVANLAFSGARWRVRRRLPKRQRAALDAVA